MGEIWEIETARLTGMVVLCHCLQLPDLPYPPDLLSKIRDPAYVRKLFSSERMTANIGPRAETSRREKSRPPFGK